MKAHLAIAILATLTFCSQGFSQNYTLGYDITGDGSTAGSFAYNVAPGDTVDVTVTLTEDVTGGGMSRLAPGNSDGLFSFSLGVDFSNFSGGANGSTFNSLLLDPLFTTGFAGSGMDQTLGPGVISFEGTEDFAGNDVDGENGVGGTMIATDIWQVELATLTFDAGDVGTTTLLNLQPHVDPAANPFVFGDGAAPPINFVTDSSTVAIVVGTAIPEPGSATVVAFIAGIGMLRRRRN